MAKSMWRSVPIGSASVALVFLSGCSAFAGGAPSSYVGNWVSTDGRSIIELKDDHTGSFTLCEASAENDDLRYDFESKSWPATIPVIWERRVVSDSDQNERIYLYQDWELREETGTGFGADGVILEWRDGALEMGADLVVRFNQAEGATFSCEAG
ncbi:MULTISPECIES: hypothetical protein [unclassified Microbacterium]|uniref:hypothetical protein n=1 Tax=unclassified Microbacterium TaxID=2609290 RepID=UPI003465FF69